MKYLLPVLLALVFNGSSQAQTFKPFKVDVGFSFNLPVTDEATNGAGFYLEPRYSANDAITFGLHLQWDYLSAGTVTIDNATVDVKSSYIQSYLLTSEYYFNTEKVRPFVGVGIGMYKKTSNGVSVGFSGIQVGGLEGSVTNFGVSPRLGINVGHFRLYTIYNVAGNDISNYISINMGIEIGGGRY